MSDNYDAWITPINSGEQDSVPEWNSPQPSGTIDHNESQIVETENEVIPSWNNEESVQEDAVIDKENEQAINFVSEDITKPVVQRRKRSGGGATGLLSWTDVGLIFDFGEKLDSLDDLQRDLFCELFDIPARSNVIDVAQALYPIGSETAAFVIVNDIVDMASSGVVGFADGIRLVNRINALPDTTSKSVARQISSLTTTDIKYRKNSPTTEFVASVFDALDKIKETGRLEKLKEFQALLDVWPGAKK